MFNCCTSIALMILAIEIPVANKKACTWEIELEPGLKYDKKPPRNKGAPNLENWYDWILRIQNFECLKYLANRYYLL